MRSWHLCLMIAGLIYSVVVRRDWARGRGPRLVLQEEGLNEFAGLFREPRGVRSCVWVSRFFGGEAGPYGGCVVHVVGE